MTQLKLKQVLHYDKSSGTFTWIASTAHRIKIGDTAGYRSSSDKYIYIRIYTKSYPAHRLAWLYVYGSFPIDEIDHINHNKSDNSIHNLREVTHQGNMRNRSISNNNTSGYNGVTWAKERSKWRAQIKVNGKTINLGYFQNIEDAVKCRKEHDSILCFHTNHGDKND